MEEIKNIIQNKRNDYDCRFILSTIHGSKGLEYDNVYIIDVKDGILPETVPQDLQHMKSEEREAYEEERRLFYVAATRAKNNLYIFKSHEPSIFIKQLFYKQHIEENSKRHAERKVRNLPAKTVPYGQPNKSFSEEEFNIFVNNLAEGIIVSHKNFGQGVVTYMDDNDIKIMFGEEIKTFKLKILLKKNMINVE